MSDTQARPEATDVTVVAETIEAGAHAQLSRSGYLELNNVDCTYRHGTLVLQGRVSS